MLLGDDGSGARRRWMVEPTVAAGLPAAASARRDVAPVAIRTRPGAPVMARLSGANDGGNGLLTTGPGPVNDAVKARWGA